MLALPRRNRLGSSHHAPHLPTGEGRLQDLDDLLAIARDMEGKTICVFADAAAWPVQSYITKFRAEFEEHIRTGQMRPAQRGGGMPNLTIDGRQIDSPDGTTVIQAAEKLGIFIPRYCYHPGLSIAGNCRICLVDVEKNPKLQIACNTPVTEGMVVHTKSAEGGGRPAGGAGIPPGQPSARLPGLRSVGRVRPSELLHELRALRSAVPGAEGQEEEGGRRSART